MTTTSTIIDRESDAELVAQSLSGNRQAFGGLAIGAFAFGGLGLGLLCVGGIAIGYFAAGGAAGIGWMSLSGACAIAWKAACGASAAMAREYAVGPTFAAADHANDAAAKAFVHHQIFFKLADPKAFSTVIGLCWLPIILVIWQSMLIRKRLRDGSTSNLPTGSN